MYKLIPLLTIFFCLPSCKKDKSPHVSFNERFVQLSTHELATYSVGLNSKYLVAFESGLGNDHSVWQLKKVAEAIGAKMDVVIYDRAGYGKSTIDTTARDINRLRIELESVVNQYAKGRKVILVGHSLGGMVIRDFAIKNPGIVAALLFVDPSHENVLQFTQEEENTLYNSINSSSGPDFGGTKEVRQLIEDAQYMSALTNLPDIPVVVLTGMKSDAGSTGNTQDLYNAHELLNSGVTDFTHIADTNSGHFIMIDNPWLVIENFNLLISKLP
jgi:pimeloyl-ACP methyl ester carboxylesterase